MKKFLAFLLAFALAFTCMACKKTEEPEEVVDENPQGLQFYMQDDGTYIVACGDAKYRSNIVIPTTYKGGAVVGIDKLGFYDCPNLTAVTIPNSVNSIGKESFTNCISLESITIPNSVTSLSIGTFSFCTSLTSVTIPNSVTSIDDAFYYCTSLININYEGTMVQWNAISLNRNWNYQVPATEVICSDGVVPLK